MNYVYNMLVIPTAAPNAVAAYQCFMRGALEGFKVRVCPFDVVTTVPMGNCTACFNKAMNNLHETTCCLGCSSNSSELVVQIYN